jgi:hypothetical protein
MKNLKALYHHLHISPDIIKPQHTWAQHKSD